MQKIYLLISVCAISFNSLFAQDTISGSVYNTSRDFLQHNPYIKKTYLVLVKHKRDSNVYDAFLLDKYKDYETLDKSVWGFYDDSTLYLNCSRLGMKKGFVKINEPGKYSYLKGRPIANADQVNRLVTNSFMFGLVGGLLTESQIRQQIKSNIHFVINLETGVCNLLNKNYIMFILREEKDMSVKFNNEPDKDSVETLITYLRLLNDRYPLNTIMK